MIRHSLIFFFICCMACLTLQSTLLSLNKAGKIFKAQSSITNPVSEEEEHHKEKESDTPAMMYLPEQVFSPQVISLRSSAWPHTSSRCLSHVNDITVPPPERG